jgi:hypothetical protein
VSDIDSNENQARYSIGVDLGTTHCALSYVDMSASDGEKTAQGVLPISQLTAPGAAEERDLLPSFLYLPHENELAPGDLTLPWTQERTFIVGELARRRGHADPPRLQREKLAVPSGRRSPRGYPAVRCTRGSRARIADGKLGALSDALARGVESRASGRAVRPAGRHRDDSRVLRSRRPRTHRRSRRGRRLFAHDAARRAASRAL